MGGNRHCRHVDRGWKERLKVTSLYAKESCSLIKLIRNLLWLCTMEAVMVLECARVCSGLLWWALLLLGGVFIYTSIKNPIPANNGLRHLSLLLKSHEMENINFDWNIFILKKSFSFWLSFLFTFWGSGGFWRCHPGCRFSFPPDVVSGRADIIIIIQTLLFLPLRFLHSRFSPSLLFVTRLNSLQSFASPLSSWCDLPHTGGKQYAQRDSCAVHV